MIGWQVWVVDQLAGLAYVLLAKLKRMLMLGDDDESDLPATQTRLQPALAPPPQPRASQPTSRDELVPASNWTGHYRDQT